MILTDKLQIHYSHSEVFCVLVILSYLQEIKKHSSEETMVETARTFTNFVGYQASFFLILYNSQETFRALGATICSIMEALTQVL